jgi:hypothetical protein
VKAHCIDSYMHKKSVRRTDPQQRKPEADFERDCSHGPRAVGCCRSTPNDALIDALENPPFAGVAPGGSAHVKQVQRNQPPVKARDQQVPVPDEVRPL